MHQSQHPTCQQTDAQYQEEVFGVFSGRIGRKVYTEERRSGNDGSAQQRHGRIAPDAVEIAFRSKSPFLVDQDAVHDDDGIVDQHTHRHDERPERDALQRRAADEQDGE